MKVPKSKCCYCEKSFVPGDTIFTPETGPIYLVCEDCAKREFWN